MQSILTHYKKKKLTDFFEWMIFFWMDDTFSPTLQQLMIHHAVFTFLVYFNIPNSWVKHLTPLLYCSLPALFSPPIPLIYMCSVVRGHWTTTWQNNLSNCFQGHYQCCISLHRRLCVWRFSSLTAVCARFYRFLLMSFLMHRVLF